MFAICSVGSTRRIVRIETIGQTCFDLAEAPFDSARFAKLAIGLPSYWD